MTDLVKFKTGHIYATTSICNHEVVYSFCIERRTAKSVWVEVDDKVVRRAIEIYNGAETFYPFGKYSMCAIIRAN